MFSFLLIEDTIDIDVMYLIRRRRSARTPVCILIAGSGFVLRKNP